MTAELLPCPHCGGEAEMDTGRSYVALGTGGRIGYEVVIYCLSCPAEVAVCHEDMPVVAPDEVVMMWNRRSPNVPAAPGATP